MPLPMNTMYVPFLGSAMWLVFHPGRCTCDSELARRWWAGIMSTHRAWPTKSESYPRSSIACCVHLSRKGNKPTQLPEMDNSTCQLDWAKRHPDSW
jgi:hypothetical protein